MYNITLLSPEVYPPRSGFSHRVWSMVRILSDFSNLSVLVTNGEGEEKPKDTNIKFQFEYPYKTGLRPQLKRLLTYYKTEYKKLTFDQIPDAIQVESLHLYMLTKHFPDRPIVFDDHNVYWNLLRAIYRDKPLYKKIISPWILWRAKMFEIQAIKEAAHVFVASHSDRETLVKEINGIERKISVIPNCIEVERYKPGKLESECGEKQIIFVGLLSYIPNKDAVQIICNKIAPKFDNSVRFQIVGENPPPVENKPENVEFTGFVKDVKSLLNKADICISPLRYGGGTRIKILEYMAMKKPIVSTSKGVEGLDVTNGRDVLLEDDLDTFATRISELLQNERYSKELGRNARKLVAEKYDYKIYVENVRRVYDEILSK